jgi:hypothetical protein
LRFDATRLRAEVEQFAEEDWRPHPQGYAGNSALILVSRSGLDNDDTSGAMAPSARLERCPYIRQIMASLQTVIGRSRLMRLAPGAEVQTHADTGFYWHDRVRIHIPVLTEQSVRFYCGDTQVHMGAGEGWVFDNWRPHRVVNPSAATRIHLVIDTVGSADFWRLVERGASAANAALHADRMNAVPFNAGASPRLPIERFNTEVVASPTTVKALAQELVSELRACRPRRQEHATLEAILTDFARDWQALWALYGPSSEGWQQFSALRQSVLDVAIPQGSAIRLPSNGTAVAEVLQSFFGATLNTPDPPAPTPAAVNPVATPPRFERPIIILSAPRSGSTLLFEMLARHPRLWTVGGESHGEIENTPGLAPGERGYHSNALGAEDADPDTKQRIMNIFARQLRDSRNRPYIALPADARPTTVRFLEKTPKNALRIPFLQAIFPNALFLFLYREPRANLGSMLDAWHSGGFVTYRELPGWPGPSWSMLLPPGWRALRENSLAEIVAFQWEAANRAIMASLSALPQTRWRTLEYSRLARQPDEVLAAVCTFAGLGRDIDLEHRVRGGLPLSQYTLSPPDPDKWKRHAAELTGVLARTESLYRELLALSNLL